MRKSIAFLALSTLALAACGKSGSEGDAGQSADPAKAAAQMAFQFQPGQYRSSVSIDKIEIPGMPPAAAAQMKGAMGKVGMGTFDYCITPEQAAKGMEAMKEHLGKGKCQWEKFDVNGTTVDTVMVCEGGRGGSIRTASHGTVTPTGAVMQGVGDMSGPDGKGMHIEETIKMERIGDCAK